MAEDRSGRQQTPSRSLSFEDVFDVITGASNMPVPTLARRSRSVRRDPLRSRLADPHYRPSIVPLLGSTAQMSDGTLGVMDSVDLRLLEYVSPIYENLMCTICVAAFVNPVRLPCEHIFCLECLGTHFQTIPGDTKTCPKCRRRVNMIADVAHPPKIVREMLDDLVVKCPNGGCEMEMHRYTIQDHVNRYCDYTLVNCPSENCSRKIERRLAADGCLHGFEECEDCNEMVMKCDHEYHSNEACVKALVTCSFCPDAVPRIKVQSHLDNDCLAYEIACSGKSLGCQFRNFRIQVEDHIRTCPMAIIAPHIEQQRTRQELRIAEQEQKIARQADQLASMERIQLKLSLLQDGLDQMQKTLFNEDGTPRSLPSPSAQPAAGSITSDIELKEHLNRQDEVNAVHFSRIEELDARMQMLFTNENIRWQQEMMALGSAVTAMRTQLNALANAYLRQPSSGGMGAAAVVASAAGHAAGGSSMGRTDLNRPRSPRRGSSSSPHREDPKL